LFSKYNYLIKNILSNSYNHIELENFVNLCTSISATYLKNELFYNRLYFPIKNKDDNDLKDISLDLIAPLFERDESKSFKVFKHYFLSDNSQLDDDSLYIRLKRIIISKTKQELIEHFKEEEPGGYKILRNIKLAPTRDNKINKFDDQSKTYFYYYEGECQVPAIDYLKAELSEIESDELLDLVRIACKKYTIIPKILEYVLMNIQKNDTCRNFIEISSLFKALKNILLFKTVPLDSSFENYGYINKQNGDKYYSKIFQELDKCIILSVKEKYIDTGKIDKDITRYYNSVLKEYFYDIIFAHVNNTLPHYLNNRNSLPIQIDNFAKHRSRISYLIKICKKRLELIISKY